MVGLSSRGEHRYFRHEIEKPRNIINYQRRKIDFLFNGHITAPPSWNAEKQWRYAWKNGIVPLKELPLFPLKPEKPQRKPLLPVGDIPDDERARRTLKGLHKICSVSGQGGDLALFKAACWVCQVMNWNAEEAFAFLWQWNHDGHCQPPWPEARIRWKISESIRLRKG